MIYASRFGALMFMPFSYSDIVHPIDTLFRFGADNRSTVFDSVNRVVVMGKQRGLNSNIVVTMNDRSSQGTAGDETVREMGRPIRDESITNMTNARKMAREILRSNNTLKTSRAVEGLPELWYARAGDLVQTSDDGGRNIIMSITHDTLEGASNLQIMSVDNGIEGVLQHLEEDVVTSRLVEPEEKTAGIVKEDMSLNFINSLRITCFIESRPRLGQKLTLGPTGTSVARGSMIGQGGYVLGVRNGHRAHLDIVGG